MNFDVSPADFQNSLNNLKVCLNGISRVDIRSVDGKTKLIGKNSVQAFFKIVRDLVTQVFGVSSYTKANENRRNAIESLLDS